MNTKIPNTIKHNKKLKSDIDSVIIDIILDHYNVQSLSGKKEVLTGEDFINICNDAEERYYENIMIDTPLGIEGVA